MRWTADNKAKLRALYNDGVGMTAIAREFGVGISAIKGQAIRQNLHARGLRGPISLPAEHPAIVGSRSLFPNRIAEPDDMPLKPGNYQTKLGSVVTKGRWKGYPIYSLTLEERATCPRSCAVFSVCYGNGMNWAKRYKHGAALEAALSLQLAALGRQHVGGFVVRLHILGDFYSAAYVDFWRTQLARHPQLRIFGYTAWPEDTVIGAAVAALRKTLWRRFAVRTSGAMAGPRTLVVGRPSEAASAITCPVETGRASNCGTCSLCWATKKPIAFVRH